MKRQIASALAAILATMACLNTYAYMQERTPIMATVPPERDRQVTLRNYRDNRFNRWAFFNMGAPTHTVVMPRGGNVTLTEPPSRMDLGNLTPPGTMYMLDSIFMRGAADAVVVVQGDDLVYEKYYTQFGRHHPHIWFSMTKSLVSATAGIFVESGQLDLGASPAKYIPELKGSGFERVTVQNVLDHDTAINFEENYTDPKSDFVRFYAPTLNMAFAPGAADAKPEDTEIYGVHDFLARFIKADEDVTPGTVFDYNSANADVLGWLLARISGRPLQSLIGDTIWSKLGAEHDAVFVVDRAYMPVATAGMNATARDAAKFGMMIRDHGYYNGQQILPKKWLSEMLNFELRLAKNMKANSKYANEPWQAYHNMWWILDAEAGEFCAVGIHGQLIYINRSTDTVVVVYSSQTTASSANNPDFRTKLNATRFLATALGKEKTP